MEERRKFVRLNIDVEVKWEKISGAPLDNINVTKNISGGGICLIVYEELRVGEELSLEIKLPTKELIAAKGKVLWISEFQIISEECKKRYDTGIEFLDICNEDREKIEKFVFALHHIKTNNGE